MPRPEPLLELPSYDVSAARALRAELGVSWPVAQILVRRGLSSPALARAFLDPPEPHAPQRLGGIDRAVELIRAHIARGSSIVVHGDYDVDGVCATALLVRSLSDLGATVSPFLPSRQEDGYGLNLHTVRRLADRGAGLLITVDCGITAVEEVDEARRLGVDVVITDHHQPRADGRLPDAPIVHPGVCDYPFPEICGTAVAYKLADALEAPRLGAETELLALATVADLMPLRDENRRLVKDGLAALANTGRPGLRALMASAALDPSEVSAGAVGFRLAPRLNAAGRLRHASAALELLLTDDPARAGEIAAELNSLNSERREVEQRILWEAEELVHELGPRSGYVLAAPGWHAGVIGIVASRIVERFHRPAVLVALDEEGAGHGSGRSVPGFDLLGCLHACAGHLERYGGHRAAAGLTVRAERLSALQRAFEAYADEWLTEELRRPVERVDAVVSGLHLGLDLAEELELLEPCGMGNPAPKLLLPGGRIEEIRPMGEGRHARFTVRASGCRARAVAFGCGGDPGASEGERVDASFRLERNVWNGAVEPRLVLRRVHREQRAAVEILPGPSTYLSAVGQELDPGSPAHPVGEVLRHPDGGGGSGAEEARSPAFLDRRGEGTPAVLADAVSAGGRVLAVCADLDRRAAGICACAGGFTLTAAAQLERDPRLATDYEHLVFLDPPTCEIAAPAGEHRWPFVHLAWGQAELAFTRQMHDLEYDLRSSLRALYRELAAAGQAAGEALELLLRGPGRHGRPPRLAARLLRVLSELELVSFDGQRLSVRPAPAVRADLERSASFQGYRKRHEEGLAWLDRASLPAYL